MRIAVLQFCGLADFVAAAVIWILVNASGW
jgi:hypothetical protein